MTQEITQETLLSPEEGEAAGARRKPPRRTTKTIGSVEKAVTVLETVARSENGAGVSEIAKAIGSSASATYHLINTLRKNDLLQQDPQSRRYSIGVGLFRICAMAQDQNVLAATAKPFLDEISRTCGETSNLVVLEDKEAVYIAQSESNHVVKMFTQLGARVPYYCTAGGKVILAYMPYETQQLILRETRFTPYTPRTIVKRSELVDEFANIRDRGYGFDLEEREEGVTCIAAPVYNASNEVVAAITVSGPSYRIESKGLFTFVKTLCRVAEALSARLGSAPSSRK